MQQMTLSMHAGWIPKAVKCDDELNKICLKNFPIANYTSLSAAGGSSAGIGP